MDLLKARGTMQSMATDNTIDGWRVSLRHHNPQAGSAIENAEVGSAIECFCSRIVVWQTNKKINI